MVTRLSNTITGEWHYFVLDVNIFFSIFWYWGRMLVWCQNYPLFQEVVTPPRGYSKTVYDSFVLYTLLFTHFCSFYLPSCSDLTHVNLLCPCTGAWENTRAWVPHFLQAHWMNLFPPLLGTTWFLLKSYIEPYNE